MNTTSDRKIDHIKLAFESISDYQDPRFNYEPLMAGHPTEEIIPVTQIGNKVSRIPLWVSSMTGGAQLAGTINHRLAEACGKFGMGMGLGSCRILLEDDRYFPDFDLRDKLGESAPFYANLGIAQIEEILDQGSTAAVEDLIKSLRADGLIIHVNPLQEWLQPEGDPIKYPPIDTIKRFLKTATFPVWVKEVGQGMGPQSLRSLIELPIQGIEFGAYGGTNFAKLETLRASGATQNGLQLARTGHTAVNMVNILLSLKDNHLPLLENKVFIISGGIESFIDGYYLMQKLGLKAIYARASAFLKHALVSTESIEEYIQDEKRGLMAAYAYLTLKS